MKYTKWLDKNIPSLDGKLYIVTGANSGIGFHTTLSLVYKGASVVMACRNLIKAQKAKEKILEEFPHANLFIEEYDQASFHSIDSFCENIKLNHPKIDGIVCNAGVYFPKADYKTKDGYELTIGTNYLGTYRLIDNLKDYLEEINARVVLVSSLVSLFSKKISIKEAFTLKRNALYNYSKCCVARFGYELMLDKSNISYRIVHPGICSTNIISSDQTGFPTWFGVLGHRILTLFTHSASKASLISIKGLVDDNENKPYITPRGLFAISGYPVNKKLPKFMDRPIRAETKELLKEE
jgi:NAD(P)-dependent dehydrogenase (short-subunit alcohol dehydrogenase family)